MRKKMRFGDLKMGDKFGMLSDGNEFMKVGVSEGNKRFYTPAQMGGGAIGNAVWLTSLTGSTGHLCHFSNSSPVWVEQEKIKIQDIKPGKKFQYNSEIWTRLSGYKALNGFPAVKDKGFVFSFLTPETLVFPMEDE